MTYQSPIQSTSRLMPNYSKGSTYGKQNCWSSDYSFQRSQRGDRSNYPYRIKVLSSQTTLFTSSENSIALDSEQTRDPSITRDS